jgi:hypothetical protein
MYNLKSCILSFLAIFSFNMIVVAQTNNQIEGTVVTEQNVPVNNAFVELYNDVEFMVRRERSSSQGRFTFRGLRAGRYIIRVKPYGTGLLEGMERVDIQDLGTIPNFEYVNIRLEADRRFTQPTETIIGTIFAQEIPNDAKRLFDSGIKKLKSQDKKGLDDIEAAIKIFPDYFEALNTLGREYIGQAKYEQGYPFLLRAIDVNARCPECFYSLTVAFYKLNQVEAGLKAAKAAVTLMPNSGDAQLLLGILLRISNNLADSEKALLDAKKHYKKPNPEVHWQLALLYDRTKRNNEAADELELYLEANPNAENKEKVKKLIKNFRNKANEEKP